MLRAESTLRPTPAAVRFGAGWTPKTGFPSLGFPTQYRYAIFNLNLLNWNFFSITTYFLFAKILDQNLAVKFRYGKQVQTVHKQLKYWIRILPVCLSVSLYFCHCFIVIDPFYFLYFLLSRILISFIFIFIFVKNIR